MSNIENDPPLCSWCAGNLSGINRICLEVATHEVDGEHLCQHHAKLAIERRARHNARLVNQVPLGHPVEDTKLQKLLLTERVCEAELAYLKQISDNQWYHAQMEEAVRKLDKIMSWIDHARGVRKHVSTNLPVKQTELAKARDEVNAERARLLQAARTRAEASPRKAKITATWTPPEDQVLQVMTASGCSREQAVTLVRQLCEK